MARGNKRRAQQQLASAHVHLEDAATHLAAAYTLFEPSHPELADALKDIALLCLQGMQMVDQFWRTSWIHEPDDYRAILR